MTDYIRDPNTTRPRGYTEDGDTFRDTSFVDDYDPHTDWGDAVRSLFGENPTIKWRDVVAPSLRETQEAVRQATERFAYPENFTFGVFGMDVDVSPFIEQMKREMKRLADLYLATLDPRLPLADQEIPAEGTE
jgi:hypothetical protein